MNMRDDDITIEPMDQLELYVLDLLDDDEIRDVEALIARDPAAQQRVAELRGTLGTLPFGLEPMDPPAGLRDRILDEARAETGVTPVEEEHAPEEPTRLFGSALWGLAAAAIIAIAFIAVLALAAGNGPGDFQTYPIATTEAATGPVSGQVRFRQGSEQAILDLTGLENPPQNLVYQVWLISGDNPPTPNITFTPDSSGEAHLLIRGNLPQSDILAITLEPQGGSPAPTSDVLIVSDLTQPESG